MYSEDDLLPLSALQHLSFCERQCALIHVEQLWEENRFTAEGRVMHEKAHDEGGAEYRDGVRIERGQSLRSLRLGVIGKADIVEFHRISEDGGWCPFPVEYKRGKPKDNDCDKVQLCAQAMCIEEMTGANISRGALFYGKIRRRLDVIFDPDLRAQTERVCERLHALVRSGHTPAAIYAEKCEACSLVDICLPKVAVQKEQVATYIKDFLCG